jgi:hypothetical protein
MLPGISDPNWVLLEVEWDEICRERKVASIVPLYLGLQAFLGDEFSPWAGNGSWVQEIWEKFKI